MVKGPEERDNPIWKAGYSPDSGFPDLNPIKILFFLKGTQETERVYKFSKHLELFRMKIDVANSLMQNYMKCKIFLLDYYQNSDPLRDTNQLEEIKIEKSEGKLIADLGLKENQAIGIDYECDILQMISRPTETN